MEIGLERDEVICPGTQSLEMNSNPDSLGEGRQIKKDLNVCFMFQVFQSLTLWIYVQSV